MPRISTPHRGVLRPIATIVGLIIVLLAIIGPALTFLGFSAYWERAIEGAIILIAVAMESVRVHSRRYADVGGF